MNKLEVVNIHISDLMDIMADMKNGEYIGLAGKVEGAEGADWYFITKLDLPVWNPEPIFVINYFGPECPWPETAPKAFYPTILQTKAALITRDLLHNNHLFISWSDYRRYK